jgi:hypothetical protein
MLFLIMRNAGLIAVGLLGSLGTGCAAGEIPDLAQVDAALADSVVTIAEEPIPDRFLISSVPYEHVGGGLFEPVGAELDARKFPVINFRQVQHLHDPAENPDVPLYTDITLPGVTPRLLDESGRDYALITLYNIDPPLEDLPSRESGIDRGMDYRDPSNILKGVYSNYVSPVLTNDRERIKVAGHPIGHFYVKVEVPGYPAILTGMTTIAWADEQLVNFTLKRELGLGGVLLTRQPGRLYSSVEVMRELSLRQRELRVIDGRHYHLEDGRNVGPTYVIKDGNVPFLRIRVRAENGRDAIGVFAEYLARGEQNDFGSLLSRPGRGSGAGCSAFAMHWLKSSGVIPFVDEAKMDAAIAETPGDPPFWSHFYRRLEIPWSHIGCDERVGLYGHPQPADYTVYDLLFHDLPASEILSASEGLAELVRKDYGSVAGTLFQYGALTPVRGLVIGWRRKDPQDRGDYSWAPPGEGFEVGFWDNAGFSDWVKAQWARETLPEGLTLVREGRFLGVEMDAMATPRQKEPFYEVADQLEAERNFRNERGLFPKTCREVFEAFSPE